jgi:hypothetical protein
VGVELTRPGRVMGLPTVRRNVGLGLPAIGMNVGPTAVWRM